MTDIDTASVLYYSDDPESLSTAGQGRREGVLFGFDVVAGARQRFLFYHVNADRAPRYIAVRLYNAVKEPVTLRYVASMPAGSAAYMHVGHGCTAGFTRGLVSQDWRSVDVAEGANVVLGSIDIGQEALAAGLLELELSMGASLRCSLIACDALGDVPAIAQAGATFKPDGKARRGKFDISNNPAVPLLFTVGGAAAQARVGERGWANQERLPDGQPGIPLKGEYGVFTRFELEMRNPTGAQMRVALFESAHGGDSTATYAVDGRLVESDRMLSPQNPPRYKVWTYDVPPGGTVASTVLTMPDSGSSSPIVLTLDADDGSPDPGEAGSIVRTSSN